MHREEKDSKTIIISTHDSLSPVNGGGALRTLRTAREFIKRGHKVIFIAPTDRIGELDGTENRWLNPPRKQRSQILSSLKFNIRLLGKFLRFGMRADMLFVHNTIAAATLPFLKKIFGFRFVLDITDIHAEYLLVGKRSAFEKILTPFLLRYEYFIIRSADFVTVATEAMRRLLISKGVDDKKIEVVYDGVDRENVPQQKEEGSENGIIHLGAVDRQHGVEVMVRAIPDIIKEVPQARFLFVGGGRELLNIKRLAGELGVMDDCVFTGCFSQERAREFLKKATIGVIPREETLPNNIVTTLKIYEYWASRTAVVSAFLEGVREIGTGNADVLYFNPGDAADLGKKIVGLLKDKAFKERLISAGSATVKRFDIGDSTSKIAGFALDQPPPSADMTKGLICPAKVTNNKEG